MELPASFIDYTRALLGDEEYDKLAVALQQEPPVSIRLNQLKINHSLSDKVPWSSEGFYLEERLTFTFDPLFHAGCYYVQEASSMFVEQVLRQYITGPVKMLDLCAAPGGKSTHARSVLPEGSLLVANEVIRNRSQILAENLTKWKMEQDLLIEQLGAEYHDYNLVIAGSRGQPVESNIIRKSMRQLIEANELPQVCFHSLRHSSITYKLKLNGGDIKAVQGDSGHAQATMVTDQYSHILDESRRNNAQLFEQAFYGGKGVKIEQKQQDKAVEEQAQQAGLNSEVLLKIFSNPDMVAMLKMLAKTLG